MPSEPSCGYFLPLNKTLGEWPLANKKYSLITRADFDGVVAAVLFKEMEMVDDVIFAHPKDMQDGKIKVDDSIITTNLPYVEGVHLCFDHHLSETLRVGQRDNHIIDPNAPSAARVVYEYYGGESQFPKIPDGLMDAVDKADSAQYSTTDILAPTGWTLLNFIIDPRTGLGRFRDFAISNDQLLLDMIVYCRRHPIEDILAIPDVEERVYLYHEHDELAEFQIERCSTMHGNLLVLDLRGEEVIHPVNRFMVYALNPEANISLHVMWGVRKEKTVFAVGKSITNRTSKTNIGKLMLEYGGGGHENAGTCQIENDRAEQVMAELIERITADG